ncbi:MAG: HAMP domain-containing histidine kinase [Planctomycetes bacterium]|nr:HAMP domain-containing histidine kinase [Planctomycetota bacterium]
MARPRRLRYKLMLGLGLVVGSILLLVAGTLFGIRAYTTTVRTTEIKMIELELVSSLVEILKGPDQPTNPITEATEFEQSLQSVETKLEEFRKINDSTIALGLDPDGGDLERGLVGQLEGHLKKLHDAIKNRPQDDEAEVTVPVRLKKHVKPHYDEARRCTEHLRLAVIDDIQTGIKQSNRVIGRTIWVVRIATFWAIVLTLTLLFYFRVWMFQPIRQLQAGISRVHGGDFEHPIKLESGDELQELADEFNAMTARLGATYADLARQVNERSRQLVRSERMVSVGFLAAGVAHEINNPLASILFCSEALERRLQDVLDEMNGAPAGSHSGPAEAEVLTRYLKMIQQEALRCKEITHKLLDFSRTGEKKRDATDLGALVRGVIEVASLLPNCRAKNISFEPKEYIVAQVNSQDLKSVILNMIVNALDSMDEGGRLSITLRTVGDQAELAFTDTGCGMTADVLENIFEPFFTRSRTGKGTGLGLFISHQIIDQHGGTIQAASQGPGFGSTFTVNVPLHDSGTGNAESGSNPEPVMLPFPGAKAA